MKILFYILTLFPICAIAQDKENERKLNGYLDIQIGVTTQWQEYHFEPAHSTVANIGVVLEKKKKGFGAGGMLLVNRQRMACMPHLLYMHEGISVLAGMKLDVEVAQSWPQKEHERSAFIGIQIADRNGRSGTLIVSKLFTMLTVGIRII